MLKDLKIINFQSHADTDIEFSNGITVFIGSSMSGKTAILRCLNWVINNRPTGDSFVRKGEIDAYGNLSVINDDKLFTITRFRELKKQNCYLLNDGNKETKFEALRAGVPEDIAQIINMSDVNIQEQLFPYFLVLDSPGKIGQFINDITGIGDIDEVVSKISSEIRDINFALSKSKTDLETTEKQLKQIDTVDLDAFEDAIEFCKTLQTNVKELENKKASLEAIVNSIESTESILSRLQQVNADEILETIKAAQQKQLDINQLINKKNVLEGILVNLEELNTKLSKTITADIPDITGAINKYQELNKKYDSISKIVKQLESVEFLQRNSGVDLQATETEIAETLATITICPMCEQELLTEQAKNSVIGK